MRQGMNGAQDTFSYGNKVKGVVERKDKKRKVFLEFHPPSLCWRQICFDRQRRAYWPIYFWEGGQQHLGRLSNERMEGSEKAASVCIFPSNGCCSDKM